MQETDWGLTLPDDAHLQKELMKGFDIEFVAQAATDIDVTCEDTAKHALSYCLQSRKIKNRIEESRKEIVRPHIDFQKAVMKFSKDLTEKMQAIENSLHNKIHDWIKKEKDNPFTCVDEIIVEDGTLTCKTVWDFEVEDPKSVPKEYLKVDDDAIEDAIKKGIRNIPGVKIFSYETTNLRIKN